MTKKAGLGLGKILGLLATVWLLLAISLPSLVAAYSSGDYGSSTYGSCQFGQTCSVTISSLGSLSLNVTPTLSGSCTIASDTVSVLTDDSNGYTLTLNDSTTNTALVNGSSSINATTGTFASPAALVANSWGYRVDSLGSFGSGPTTAQSNAPINGTTFATIEASNASPDTLADTSIVADPAVVTTVWYGVCANSSANSGAYSSQIIYTALAN